MNKPKEVTTSPSFQHHTDVQFNFVVSLSGLNKFLKLKKKNPGRASHVYSSQTQKCWNQSWTVAHFPPVTVRHDDCWQVKSSSKCEDFLPLRSSAVKTVETAAKEKMYLRKSPEGRLTQALLAVHPTNISDVSPFGICVEVWSLFTVDPLFGKWINSFLNAFKLVFLFFAKTFSNPSQVSSWHLQRESQM